MSTLTAVFVGGPIEGTHAADSDIVLESRICPMEAEAYMRVAWPVDLGGKYRRLGDDYVWTYDEEPTYDGTGDAWAGGFASNH